MSSKLVACLTVLVAVASAAAADPAPPGAAGPAAAAPPAEGQLSGASHEEQMAVPPGSPQDQALWKAGNDLSERIVIERALSSRLQWAGRNLQHAERLEALAKGGEPPVARQAAALLERYRAVQALDWQTATRQWPVDPTRGCRYQVLDLQGVMYAAETPRRPAQLAMMRDRLKECIEKGRPALQVMADLNADLEAAQKAADALLGPLPAAAPPALEKR
jgi:hypothetical protein